MRSCIDSIRDCGVVLKLERFSFWPWVPIIGAFLESRWIEGKGYPEAGVLTEGPK